MSKQSGWKIAATEGATVDGRTITKQWILDMAEQYSITEYAALIWPEHSRSRWDKFEGKNWGTVDEAKAEKQAGKYRLLVKLSPNKYLLNANADGQKLFMSVEPNPDYCGSGRCYLMGLAVTDSPSSTGTTLLKFSQNREHEYSQLEELDLSDVLENEHSLIASAFSTIANFFSSGGQLPNVAATPSGSNKDEEPMNTEQFNQVMGKLNDIETKQDELEEKQTEFASQVEQFSTQGKPETEPTTEDEPKPKGESITAEQFSQVTEKLDTLLTKQGDMENQFNALKQEVPNQVPAGEGNGHQTKLETF
ncbi:GPO family capsid scaffolding protein [Photobacterium makurazakiensis]|uniref:GPO family capsid scaffolding protein n=1 Tax=Photobacterium makurazakiensis TaxID=2910234 RepID=UPI003D1355DB